MWVGRWSSALTAAVAAAALAGCGNGGGVPTPGSPNSAPPGATTQLHNVHLTAADLSSLARDDDRFAGDLMRAITSGGSDAAGTNIVVSPASVAIVLQMLADGAAGQTREQLIRALHDEGLGERTLTAASAQLFADLRDLGDQLSISDAVWLQHGLAVTPSFAADMRQGFAAGLHDIDFGDPSTAAQTIDDAISRATHGHITNLMTPAELAGAVAVLTDAVYLTADWSQPFSSAQTRPDTFTVSSGHTEQVPTMHQSATFDFIQHEGFQAVNLPYQGGRLAMSVLLPASGSSPAAVEALAAQQGWSALLDGASPTKVTLALPRFETRTTLDLTGVLQHLGITDAFGRNADLTGICRQCAVSSVQHQAWIKTDEKGTTAAAATGAVVVPLAIRENDTGVVMNVDRPFLAVVRDTRTGLPLFVAQIGDPAATAD